MTNLWKIKTIDLNLHRVIPANPAEVFRKFVTAAVSKTGNP